MIKVEQRLVDSGVGDCMTATLATLLELPYEAVPNFNFLQGWIWHNVFDCFLYSLGWSLEGNGHPDTVDTQGPNGFDGFYMASVPSRNYEGKTHSLVMDSKGVVVHDPNPKKNWQGVNIIQSGDLIYFYMVSKRTDENWMSWLRAKNA